MPTNSADQPQRYYILDALRGFAAVSVLIWHYQHFFMVAPQKLPDDFDVARQPFFAVLKAFYLSGDASVQLFFVLSGFIFFSQYLDVIQAKQASGRLFFVRRIARLYPVHIVTLLAVAALQLAYLKQFGEYSVYAHNDLNHFILNLFLASYWIPGVEYSFNGPVWSVSVEVLLYVGFFLCARLTIGRRDAAIVAATVFAIGVTVYADQQSLITAFACFFAGGLTFFAVTKIPQQHLLRASLVGLTVGITFFAVFQSLRVLFFAVYPALIFCAAALQHLHANVGRSLRWLGDISFALYLVHFPLQIAILLVVRSYALQIDFYSVSAFAGFFAASFALAIAVHYGFERPARRWMRQAFEPPVKTSAAAPRQQYADEAALSMADLGAKSHKAAS